MKVKPRLLDLFCCGGGAAMGYHLAGFEVIGVDIAPQPGYPFEFMQGDALDYVTRYGEYFDMIHASPPCQGYSPHVSSRSSKFVPTLGKDEPRLICDVKERILSIRRPYVIENVMGAWSQMNANLTLCGTMFGLPISRHRLFECSFAIMQPVHGKCSGVAKRFAAERGWEYRDMSVTGKGRRKGTAQRWSELLGITWKLSQHQLAEAIPPSYTRYIGEQFLANNLKAVSA